jgi:hypothetical protein
MRSGHPLRALAVLGMIVMGWLVWRAPQMAGDARRLAAGLAPPRLLAEVMPASGRPVIPAASPVPPAAATRSSPLLPMRPPLRRHALFLPAGAAPAVAPPIVLPDAPSAAPPSAPTAGPAAMPGPEPPVALSSGFALAEQAYQALRAGDRRAAARLFDRALVLEPGNRQWRADARALSRRWQVEIFSLLREAGAPANPPGSGLPGFAASPVLGGGQSGASIAFLPDPLARRPLAIVARANVAADSQGVRSETAQAAIGLRQTLLTGVTLSAERLIPIGQQTRGDWTLRLAAGATRGRLEAYGEGGVLGRGDVYGGAQASARLLRLGPATLGAGAWASVQTGPGTPDTWRVDVGPTIATRWRGIRLQADWRERVGGNATPGSGPVLTLAAGL